MTEAEDKDFSPSPREPGRLGGWAGLIPCKLLLRGVLQNATRPRHQGRRRRLRSRNIVGDFGIGIIQQQQQILAVAPAPPKLPLQGQWPHRAETSKARLEKRCDARHSSIP
ncbi:hypothetical protein GWK47_015102 [Chionoecetes opilio]|uniref:Uncharacterized protein n=1 Tax=Chionoecetes opilio TaxID=41210 RepID=A0A8J4XZG0_CHIOP|nr:hypothetical protein GWK47_015102 [Chionoecetes opilio]